MSQLVGDRDRDRAALELRRHYSEGRLTTDELAQRLETALRARNGAQLRRALKDLPAWWADSGALRSPVRLLRNAALLVVAAVMWVFLSVGLLIAFVAWLAANGPGLGGLMVFPLLWFASTWLLWRANRRLRARP
jgi:ABC-type multidrug transport system fused ATPase/permease subunit